MRGLFKTFEPSKMLRRTDFTLVDSFSTLQQTTAQDEEARKKKKKKSQTCSYHPRTSENWHTWRLVAVVMVAAQPATNQSGRAEHSSETPDQEIRDRERESPNLSCSGADIPTWQPWLPGYLVVKAHGSQIFLSIHVKFLQCFETVQPTVDPRQELKFPAVWFLAARRALHEM